MHKMDKWFMISVFSFLADLLPDGGRREEMKGSVLLEVLPEERNPEIYPLQGSLR